MDYQDKIEAYTTKYANQELNLIEATVKQYHTAGLSSFNLTIASRLETMAFDEKP